MVDIYEGGYQTEKVISGKRERAERIMTKASGINAYSMWAYSDWHFGSR